MEWIVSNLCDVLNDWVREVYQKLSGTVLQM